MGEIGAQEDALIMKEKEARGRTAIRPRKIPLRGWKDILWRVKNEVRRDRVPFVSAGVAFYLLLALVPLLVAFVALYGLVAEPSEVGDHLANLRRFLPEEMITLLTGELQRVAADQDAAGIGFFIGLVMALWGGTKATDALIIAMNVAYEEKESRNFFVRKALSLGLTLGSTFFFCLAAVILGGVPALAGWLGSYLETVLTLARWPVLFMLAMFWASVLYRYAPSRARPQWSWVSWGAFGATLLWVAGSVGLSLYVQYIGKFGSSYGSLGTIIVLMLWFFISAFAVVIGAELNAEMEHQTGRDTTTGDREPRGDRDAHVADHLGPVPQ